jgi:nucleoside-diphosphate-sugar epimerase
MDAVVSHNFFTENYSAVVFGGGATSFASAEKNKYRAFKTGVESLIHWIGLCKTRDTHLIFLSSYAAIGEGTPENPRPVGVYGKQKRLMEQILQESGVKHTILRLSNVVCKGTQQKRLFDVLCEQDTVRLGIKDGKFPVRNFVDVVDVIKIIEIVIGNDELDQHILHVYNPNGSMTTAKFVNLFTQVTDKAIQPTIGKLSSFEPLVLKIPKSYMLFKGFISPKEAIKAHYTGKFIMSKVQL